MATTKKTTAPETVEEVVETKVEEAAEKMVTVMLPKVRAEQEDLFVSVNERTFIVKRGVPVEVPACVAEVIQNSDMVRAGIWSLQEAHNK